MYILEYCAFLACPQKRVFAFVRPISVLQCEVAFQLALIDNDTQNHAITRVTFRGCANLWRSCKKVFSSLKGVSSSFKPESHVLPAAAKNSDSQIANEQNGILHGYPPSLLLPGVWSTSPH